MNVEKVLYVLRQYPQITETYIQTEIRVLEERGFEVDVIALNVATQPSRNAHSFHFVPQDDERAIADAVRALRPDVVHSHELDTARRAYAASCTADVPFTLRTHSYDVMGLPANRMRQLGAYLGDDRCIGALAFPFGIDPLVRAGVPEHKLYPCFPVLDYDRFHDESPNGDAVMNVGACQPKKGMDQFVQLASTRPDMTFDLWAVGFEEQSVRKLNDSLGCPVNLMAPVEHERMPAHYKRHEWLVYTAADRTVGWPVAVAEAQACGVGVCMQCARPDVTEYVGTAGFVFETIDEVAEIISRPFPDRMRRLGFEQARRSDARCHIDLLQDMWRAH